MQNRIISSIIILLLLVGCGSDNPLGRQAISGRVTFDGAALDQGTIEFSPASERGVTAGAAVRNGEYSIPALKGLPPGKYIVRINSVTSDSAHNTQASSELGMAVGASLGIERIAPAYNVASKITAEIVAGHAAEFNFDTKSK
jgi:hypothetical protein